jgi:hypothetical protein
MENDDTTNPVAEAPEADAQEVELNEDSTLAADDADEAETDGEDSEQEEEYLDIERNGKIYKIPKAVEDLLMFQKDYTQKRQVDAELRRELDAKRQAIEWEERTRGELFKEEAQLHGIRSRLEQFQNVNWQALAQQDVQKYAAAQAEYTQLKDYADRLSGHVEGRRTELKAAHEQETAIAVSRAFESLSKPDPDRGWDGKFDADKRTVLTKFGMEVGEYNIEELADTTDPRAIRMLNLAKIGYETLRKQAASLKPAAPVAKPVPQVVPGKTRTGPVNPDKLSGDEWLKWRESQLAKKQQTRR